MVLLSRKEVAVMLGVSLTWLTQAEIRGDGPPLIRMSPGMIRYDSDALKKWLANRGHIIPRPNNRLVSMRRAAAAAAAGTPPE